MTVLLAAVTDDGRKYWPRFFGGLYGVGATTVPATPVWNPLMLSFKFGEGGWIDNGAGPVPRAPASDLRIDVAAPDNVQDIDAIVDASRIVPRYDPASRGWVEKLFVPGDITYPGLTTFQLRCFLDFGEFNTDGLGNFPEIWEVGVFCDHPLFARLANGTVGAKRLMIAYTTFQKEIKNPGVQVEHFVQLVF